MTAARYCITGCLLLLTSTLLAAYQQGAPVYEQLGESLQHLNRILRDLEPLMNTLSRKPNALIFGAPSEHDPIPQAAP